MLQVSNLGKRFGETLLFEKANFVINSGERVGLVGPNGCGKTSLLRILVGQEPPDTGSARFSLPAHRVGYLAQALEYAPDATVRTALAGGASGDEDHWAARVQELADAMATVLPAGDAEAIAALEHEYEHALEQLSGAADRLPDHVVARVLAGLGLAELDAETPVEILSGGQKTRLSLARILLENPAFLILDEPTNHLDITALEWLEGYLGAYAGGMLIVSHDRTFLDRTVTRVLEIDPATHAVADYAGTYSDYVAAKRAARQKQWQAYKDQQDKIARLEESIRGLKTQASNIEHETIAFHPRAMAKKIARHAVMHQRRLERLIDSEEMIDRPDGPAWEMKLDFVNTPPSGQDVLVLDDLAKSFGDHLLFERASLILRRGERIALVGPNGSGKTTLIRMVVGQETPSAGSIRVGANVKIGYFSQEQESLDWDLTPLETVRRAAALSETDARGFLHFFLFGGDDVFVPVGRLSYGERARLALGVLVLQGCNLLLLDEPINHLDIPSRERFEEALESFEGTILAVVHDRYFVERFATGVWAVTGGTVRRFVDLHDLHRATQEGRPGGTLTLD